MFTYDDALLAAARRPIQSIDDVLLALRAIDATCDDGDGLKWFNWLYLRVTEAVGRRIAADGLADVAWLAELDVRFARLYLAALDGALSARALPRCWRAMFSRRGEQDLARIQFALAGINAHINHDLTIAITATHKALDGGPTIDDVHHRDYSALNATLAEQVDAARDMLRVRLLGDALPVVSHLEETIAAWSVAAAREAAWTNAEVLWALDGVDVLSTRFVDMLDGVTTLTSRSLLVPVPRLL